MPESLADAKTKGIPVIAYGQVVHDVVNFPIVAFVIFLLVKQVSRLRSHMRRYHLLVCHAIRLRPGRMGHSPRG